MQYEFRENNLSKKKLAKVKKSNKRKKRENKKIETKIKKIKQKNLINKQQHKNQKAQQIKGEDITITRDDIKINDNKNTIEWYIAGKKWKTFNILNKNNETFIDATLDDDIPSHLRWSFVVWDIILYKENNWKNVIIKRKNRINYISKTRSNTSRFGARTEQITAANIDIALIVSPIKNPNFDHKLVDRYLVLCQNRWVNPVICLNKTDLTKNKNPILIQYEQSKIPVIKTSTIKNTWITKLKKILTNKTAILLWKSWVGKSSLINIIYPDTKLLTQEVNIKSGEWKHTTTSSNLYKRAPNSYIIDTPGIRALWIDQIEKSRLKDLFPEFIKYEKKCKYKKCLHKIEPDCAIKKAVEKKEINKQRYESYIRILDDLV